MPRQRAADVPAEGRHHHFLKEWRKFRRLRQHQVAAQIGETPSSLSQLENGKHGYTQWKLETLARIYQTDPASLLSVNPLEQPELAHEMHRIWADMKDTEREQALAHLRVIKSARSDG